MGDKARKYKPSTVRRLDTLSGNECAEPSCKKPLIAEDGISIVSKICHIEAASDKGPRWNIEMTDDERRHYNNLILLCDEHHVIIDNKENESRFPKELLIEWKKAHESKQRYKLRNSSLIKMAIDAISDLEFDTENESNMEYKVFNIEDKIAHNDIKRNRFLIDEYKVFFGKVKGMYEELEAQGTFKRDKLLRNVKGIYLKVKGRYVKSKETEIEDIRLYADDIFEEVDQTLFELVKKDGDFFVDDITYGISVIMVDSFMRCKILEEPVI